MAEPATNLPRIAAGLAELEVMSGVSQKTLRRWAREEGLPTCRVRGRVLVVVEDFIDWLREHRELAPDEVDAAVERAVRGRGGTA